MKYRSVINRNHEGLIDIRTKSKELNFVNVRNIGLIRNT
jgi:hypothetical protein